MRNRPLSASSIKTYLQCKFKYCCQYEDKKPRGGKSDPLAFGIAMHETLEYISHQLSDGDGPPTPPTPALYASAQEVFMRSAVTNGLQDLATYQEGKDMIIARLDSADASEKVLGLELRFKLETPNGIPYTGSIDKLIELDKDTLAVIDYKTSRVALTQPEADVDIQLSMYDLAVSKMFPQYKTIVCALDYLRLGEAITHRTPEQRVLFTAFLDATHADICATQVEDAKPNMNFFCPWCDFRSFCGDYQRLITDPDIKQLPLGELGDEEFITLWEKGSSAKKTIEMRQREFTAEAYERMKTKQLLRGEESELYKVQTTSKNYDPRTISKAIGQEEFAMMASVSKGAVDKFLRSNPEYAKQLEQAATFSFRTPYFRVRKIKG